MLHIVIFYVYFNKYLQFEICLLTFATLFVIASLLCLVVAIRKIKEESVIPYWLVLVWLLVNSIGLSIHYFFCLTLISEIITLIFLYNIQPHEKLSNLKRKNYYRIFLVIIGTFCTGLMWLLIIIP